TVAIERCRARLSGPLLDRLVLHVRVTPTEVATLLDSRRISDSNAVVRLRVARARARPLDRQGALNSALTGSDLERYALPDRETCDLLQFTARRSTSRRASTGGSCASHVRALTSRAQTPSTCTA